MKSIWLFLLCLGLVEGAHAQRATRITSPDRHIVFSFFRDQERLTYSIKLKEKTVVERSEVALFFNGIGLETQVKSLPPGFRSGVDDYVLPVGKASHIHEAFQEGVFPLEDNKGLARVNLVVRVYNDGVAFRYEWLRIAGTDSLVLTDERSSIHFAANTVVHALFLPNFTSSHEGFYQQLRFQDLPEGQLMDMPVLFEVPGSGFVAITEAALVNHAGMYLVKENGVVRSTLSPWPGQKEIKVKASLPHQSPWRVLLISDRMGALVESNLITNLNEPCALPDTRWIRPGKTTFPWWNGNVVPDSLNAPGNNFVTQQYYIDFCARNGIEYHSVVEYGLHQWYVDDGIGFSPGLHSDVTKAVPGLDMKEVCAYAKSRGVGVRVWVHWAALYPKLDSAFAAFERWGLSGLMVDFMDRDDQFMVNIQNEILKKAADHNLHIQFHGAYKPTGRNRTYPNEFTREGTLNYEINKWDNTGLPPDHDIMIPFTRMLAGSTDYHLGGFRAVTDDHYRQQYTRPLMRGTRAHMMAMYVVLENYLGMVCDFPDAYEGQPGFDWIREVPTVWDETRVLEARVGEYIVIARRKGQDWYVGAITNHEARQLTVSLGFLSPGTFVGRWDEDARDVLEHPNHIVRSQRDVVASDKITVEIAGGGGMVMVLKKR